MKKPECQRILMFLNFLLEKTLESPLDCKEIQPVHPKGNQSECSLEGLMIKLKWSHSVVSDSLWPHELQHERPPCPSPTPGVHSNLCPSSRWCHPAISSPVVPFSSCFQFSQHWGSFQMSQFFTFSSVQFSHSAVPDSLWPYELQHARPACPSPTPRVHSDSCPSSRWFFLTPRLIPRK